LLPGWSAPELPQRSVHVRRADPGVGVEREAPPRTCPRRPAPPRPPPPAGSSCAPQAVWVSVAREGVRNRLGAGAAALCVPARAVRPWGPWLPSGGRVLMRSRSSGRRGHAWCGGPGPTRSWAPSSTRALAGVRDPGPHGKFGAWLGTGRQVGCGTPSGLRG
jgi:hypothetical protein